MVFYWITFIVLLIITLVLVTALVVNVKNGNAKEKNLIKSLNNEYERHNDLQTKYDFLQKKIDSVDEVDLKITIKTAELEQINSKYEENLFMYKKMFAQLDEDYESRKNDLELICLNINEDIQKKKEEFDILLRQQNNVVNAMQQTESRNVELEKERYAIEQQINSIQEDLKRLCEQHRIALFTEEGKEISGNLISCQFPPLTANEEKLITLIEEIKVSYPELAVDLGKIVWSKIWLSKMQTWIRIFGIDKLHNVIYKITRLDDTNVCYIGQAIDVKERWYTHVKKLVGAELAGGEKLYNSGLRPDAFRWEILENGLKDKNEMNEHERYWIDFFGGREIGLNKV